MKPVAYITKSALEALTSGRVSSVRVWARPSDAEDEVPLCVAPCKHKYWGAGEPDCPEDIKAPNGELHTMRCKLCGDKP